MRTFTFIDFETTGLDPETSFVIEIAAIKVREDGEELGRYESMAALPEGESVPSFITKLTGIRDEDLNGAPPEKEAMQRLVDFIGDTIVVAHHAPFELGFMREVSDFEPQRFICTRVAARLLHPDESAKLADAVKRWGVELDGHHRALNDTGATAEMFFRMMAHIESHGIEIDLENHVLDSSERPLSFFPKHTKQVTQF